MYNEAVIHCYLYYNTYHSLRLLGEYFVYCFDDCEVLVKECFVNNNKNCLTNVTLYGNALSTLLPVKVK